MNKLKVLFCLLLLAIAANLTIYVKATDEVPDNGAKITSAQIIQTKTGTGPWDENDDPGNDSSDENDVIRSFDHVTWTIENTMGLNNVDAEGYSGGRIYFEAKLPNNLNSSTAAWNLDAMGWIEYPTLSEDKMTLSGYYQLGTDTITVPGKQTLLFEANIYGAKNDTKFAPEFKLWMNGNGNENVKTVNSKMLTVSSKPGYNLRIVRGNIDTTAEIDVDGSGELKEGKVYNYNMLFQMYGDNSAKGLKGMDYPQGDITFDINLQLDRTTSGVTENITNLTDILLYNYSVTGDDGSRAISGRPTLSMYSGIHFPQANRYTNKNPSQNVLDRYIYKSGNMSMEQEGNVIHVTIKNYDFDGIFSTKSYDDGNNNILFADNVANVSKICFQVYVLNNDETQKAGSNYYLRVSDNNMKVTSISGTEVTNQKVTNDDATSVQYVAYNAGSYWNDFYFYNTSGAQMHSAWNRGDGVAYKGQVVYGTIANFQSSNNRSRNHTIRSINALYKFDDKGFRPTTVNGNKYVVTGISNTKYKMNFYYAAKPDGSGWNSATEMNNAKFEDLVYYESLEELEADGKVCIGTLFETEELEWFVPESTTSIQLRTPLQVLDTAEYGQTYQECGQIRFYKDQLDRTTESMAVENGAYTSSHVYQSYITTYIKTEYDENGVQNSGTHVSIKSGNSLLIIGAKSVVKNEIVNLASNGSVKTSYDMGRSEYDVTYKISPTVNKAVSSQSATTTTLKITDNLPKGLTYVPNSCSYGEPEISVNPDGSTNLVWYLYDIEVGQAITPFTFKAHIDEESTNGTQYTTVVTVFAGDIDKTKEENRQSSNTISIVNLSSHRLFKTDVTPVIEEDGTIHFVVSYKNNTDEVINNFQLLDVLPYNGDDRGTSFNGNYKIEKIELFQQDVAGVPISNNNLKIYYTNDESARNANSKDSNLAEGWTEATSSNIMANGTAIVVKGKVLGQEKVNIDIYLKTDGNKGLDKYVNKASAQVYVETEEMVTSKVTTQVVLRTIEGIAWKDANANGIKDANEEVFKNVAVTLTDATGAQVTDVDGHAVTTINTDDNGYYKFTNLPRGNYLVKVTIPDDTYTLTEKEVGSNPVTNSKFNVTSATTDEITKLNSLDLPELTQSNVNAGFVKKPTKVVVNYLEKGTTTKLLPEYTINGRIDDEYGTTNRIAEVNAANGNKYNYDSVDGEVSGLMVEDTIYITYYYVKKDTQVKVLHVEEGTDVSNPESVTDVLYATETLTGKVDDEYNTSNRLTEINNTHTEQYDFVRSTTNTSGTMKVNTVYVIYEYKKAPAVVKVNHLEQGTGTVLSPQETLNGIVGLGYETSNKLDAINAENENKYELVTPEPSNKNGTYSREEQTVTYYYQKKESKVVILHVDSETDITNPATITDVLYPTEEKTGRVDDLYNSVERTNEINASSNYKYALDHVVGSANGNFAVDTIYVIYVYAKQDTVLYIKHVDVITGEELDSITVEGYIGDIVTTREGTFENYRLYEKPSTEEYTLTEEPITVTYYYIRQANVITKYVDEVTGNEISTQNFDTYDQNSEYGTVKKDIPEYTYTTDTGNTTGTIGIDDVFVTYYYKKNTSLLVRYIDYYTEEEISPSITMNGIEGQDYETEQKEIDNYVYVDVIGTPAGQMAREPQEIIYRYKKQANLITEHIDANTGEKIIPDVIKKYMEKEEYEAYGQNIPGYVLVQEPESKTGVMGREDVTKTFYYKKISGGLIVKYVDVLTGDLLAQEVYEGTEGEHIDFDRKRFLYYVLYSTPEVESAELTVEPQEYIYYYIRLGEVPVKGIVQGTDEVLYTYKLTGIEGDSYQATPRNVEGYELVVIPDNERGTYQRNAREVVYEYRKIEEEKYGDVVVKYIVEGGEELGRDTDNGKVGETFHFEERTYEGYEVVSRPDSLDGEYIEGTIELVFVLRPVEPEIVEGTIIVKFVDKNGNVLRQQVVSKDLVGEDYYLQAPEIDGYHIISEGEVRATYIEGELVFEIVYDKDEEIPADPDPHEDPAPTPTPEPEPQSEEPKTVDTSDMNMALVLVIAVASISGITLVKKYIKD